MRPLAVALTVFFALNLLVSAEEIWIQVRGNEANQERIRVDNSLRSNTFSAHEQRVIELLRQKGYLPRRASLSSITRTQYVAALERYQNRQSNAKKNRGGPESRETGSIQLDETPITIRQEGSCPETITRFMPDGVRPLCGAVYTKDHCNGYKLPVQSGARINILGDDYYGKLSSAEINPNCVLMLCTRAFLEGTCTGLDGDTTGKNIFKFNALLKNSVRSLQCTCIGHDSGTATSTPRTRSGSAEGEETNTCPTIFDRFVPHTVFRLCAVAYPSPDCGGPQKAIGGPGSRTSFHHNDPWANVISSIRVNAGCQLDACIYADYSSCRTFFGGPNGTNYATLPDRYNDNIMAYVCECGLTTTPSSESAEIMTTQPIESAEMTTQPIDRCSGTFEPQTDDNGDLLCAVGYHYPYCVGRRVLIPAGSEVSFANAREWADFILSIQVYPRCRLHACRQRHHRNCRLYEGAENGASYETMSPVDNGNITSYKCECSTRSTTTTSSPSTTSATTTGLCTARPPREKCAAAYKDSDCGGERLLIESGNITARLDLDWSNSISSVQVKARCTLEACYYSSFQDCINLEGGNDGKTYPSLPSRYDNNIMSFTCTCSMEAVTDPVIADTSTAVVATTTRKTSALTTPTTDPHEGDTESDEQTTTTTRLPPRLQIGRAPPPVIPGTPSTPTCAALSTALRQSVATVTWMKAEEVNRTEPEVSNLRYTYGITAPRCSLFYCSRANFTGTCKSLGPLEHVIVLAKFKVGSYVCDC